MSGYDATSSRNSCGHSESWYARAEGTLHVTVYVEGELATSKILPSTSHLIHPMIDMW